MSELRICFIGDSITAGTGDEALLGWPGRICVAARQLGHAITAYNLGVRGDTSADVLRRWREEASRRLPAEFSCALVFAFGLNDCVMLDNSSFRVEAKETKVYTKLVLSEAREWLPVVLIGPAPIDETRPTPQLIRGRSMKLQNTRIAQVNRILAETTAEFGVPYLDVFSYFVEDAIWQDCLREGDGIHPTRRGYDLLADRVNRWPAWDDCLTRARKGRPFSREGK